MAFKRFLVSGLVSVTGMGLQLVSEARSASLAVLAGVAVFFVASATAAAPCVVPDSGGTAVLPPGGCDYLGDSSGGANDKYVITGGLPPGVTIELVPIHKDYICGSPSNLFCSVGIAFACEAPGSGLGGLVSCAGSTVELQVSGTGPLAGFSRTLSLPTEWETHSGPRTLGDAVQSFPTEMVHLSAQIFGDPDFDLLRIRAGSAFGLPSPGHTVLTELPGSQWNVDSFFDITYTIEFQGAPGGQLDGFSGTTTSSLRIRTGEIIPTASPVSALSQLGAASLAALLLVAGTALMLRRRAEVG